MPDALPGAVLSARGGVDSALISEIQRGALLTPAAAKGLI